MTHLEFVFQYFMDDKNIEKQIPNKPHKQLTNRIHNQYG